MSSRPVSLRRFLLIGILVPVLAFVGLAGVSLYASALESANSAYDRTLLASAKAIGERLHMQEVGGRLQVQADMPYSALEAFEADNRSRLFYSVRGLEGATVSGFEDLPPPRPAEQSLPNPYAALVHFYEEEYRDEAVRMAVLLQPVAGPQGYGMATIQVAETLELRHALARRLLLDMAVQQALLLGLIAAVVVLVVQRATLPVRRLSQTIRQRPPTDLNPLSDSGLPRELQPVVEACNQFMAQRAAVLDHQKRFVRDASHQLRTPLAVLKTQVQSAQRGDLEPRQALGEMALTVERATELANQMLAMAKVEQLREQGLREQVAVERWDEIVRALALDLAPLIAERRLDFELHTEPASVRGHVWALRELVRNLLHNAVKFSPEGGPLQLRLATDQGMATFKVIDCGPGLAPDQRMRLFQPFAAGLSADRSAGERADLRSGSGLGLAICDDIVHSLGGSLALDNRPEGGLVATVRLPLASG